MTIDLGFIDATVMVILIAISLAIGMWSSRKNSDVESYLVGGRSLPWWAILGSIVATETSTATVLSIPGVGYSDTGMRWLQLAFGFLLGRFVVVTVFLPLYFQGRLLTAYQVLETRFGRATKTAAALLFLMTRNLGDGLRLFLAGVVVHSLLGISFPLSVVLMSGVTIVYTFFGGLRSVIWNDCIQFVIYMLGGVAAVFIIVHQIPGGWDQLITFAENTNRLQIFESSFELSSAYNIWAGLIGGAVLTIGTHGTDHMMVQRYLSARSERDAGRAVMLSAFVVLFQFAMFLFIGVQLACFYSLDGNMAPAKSDQVFAHFLVNHFPQNTGLTGLMLAAILAAAMSTLSSSLSASASSVLNDLYVPSCRTPPSDQRQLQLSRWLTLAFGVLQMAIGIFAMSLADTVVNNALTIAGFSAGLLLGVFSLGVLVDRAGEASALSGLTVGLIVLSVVKFGLKDESGGSVVAWPWLALTGATATFLTGLAVAFVFPKTKALTQ
ncbi:MAG: sodium:solute symporter [Planctomycetaceae bacterium]|nr:sodium:solute symporter [Planctomycetaceae bacterium]